MDKRNLYIDRAIERAGGLTALGNSLGVSASRVYNWRQRGRVPIGFAWGVAKVIDIHPAEICPDWPTEVMVSA